MRDSKLLVILVIMSIFAIVASIFFFVRNKNQEPESIDDVVIENDRRSENSETSLDKEIQPYVAPSTASKDNNAMSDDDDSTTVDVSDEVVTQVQEEVANVAKVPDAPTVTSFPSETDKDSVTVEVNGEVGAEIFVNDWGVGTINNNGKKEISLNTAGGDGDKSFSIFLKNKTGKSGVLKVVIKKKTTTVTTSTTTTSSSSSSSTSSSSVKGDWEHSYTNEEYFDIDDYKDDDIAKLKLRDVCAENGSIVNYCYKTSKLDDDADEDDLGEDKCPSSCTIGKTCLLWNSEEKSSGSLQTWVALYRCE